MTSKNFYKHCTNTARHKGILNLIALVEYLENNKEIDQLLGVERSEALEIAQSALDDYRTDLKIKSYMSQ